ncbi:glycosyltransferase [Mucilaginibacter sp.]|uniref:glycosyltransferase n=1 Tax=Mucilaginibacter sp. TaxID=1882438 RepID=UPI003B000DA2
MSVKEYDIFIIAQSRWDNPYSSVGYCLAKEFSKKNRVFYIDHPFSAKDIIKEFKQGNKVKSRLTSLLFGKKSFRKIEGSQDNFTLVIPKLTFPINWLNDSWMYQFLSGLNDKVVLAALKKTIKKYQVKEYIFINSFDPYFFRSFPKAIAPAISIYQTIDDMTQEKYIARHGVRLEKEALKKADLSLATSTELTRLMSAYTHKVFCLPNAADFSLFAKAFNEILQKPKELEGISQPVIGYIGVIGTRINYGLLKQVALCHTDKLLLMVGPKDSTLCQDFGLENLPNVVFTGQKKMEELPAYLQNINCAIIPFEYSVLTKSIYPLKINEYLSAGKPVVATAFSQDIRGFAEVAYIAETDEEFLQNIDLAIREDSEEKKQLRIKTAEKNTWEARVERFWNILAEQGFK